MADWWSGNEGWQDVWGGAGGIAQTRKRAGTALKKLSNTRRYQVTKSTGRAAAAGPRDGPVPIAVAGRPGAPDHRV